ncbi:hypothetical protein [Streptomyces sp. NPDC054838]
MPDRPGGAPRGLLPAGPPARTADLAAHRDRAEPLLPGLRQPFARHAAVPDGWIRTFREFEGLLRDWDELVAGARRRGWGLIGLPL